jgi:predicted amidohydrolase YtcJ
MKVIFDHMKMTPFLFYRCTGYAFLVLFITFSSCTTSPDNKADTILVNGKIITVDQQFSIFEALAIKNGKILEVGSNEEIRKMSGKYTEILDLKGYAVIPGIIEAHAHPIQASQSELDEEIPDVTSVDELLTWIYQQAQKQQNGAWIIHPKFFATRMDEMRPPTLEELDSVAPQNPVFLNGSYGGVINSQAFLQSDISSPYDHPGILKDEITGKPNGLIRRSAFGLLKIDKKNSINDSIKLEALKKMFSLYNQVGITSVCSGLGSTATLNLFKTLDDQDALTVRVFQNIHIPFSPEASTDEIYQSLKNLGYKTGDGDEWVKIGALKTVMDGGILTGTAFLREPWGKSAKEIFGITDPDYQGVLNLSKADLVRMITVATQLGWKFTAHVTGGGGVDTLLAAYEEVNKTIPIGKNRFSIIHGNFFTPQSIQIMAKLGVYADMQPAWFYKDGDLMNRVLGKERINTFHPYRSLTEAGIVVNGGSDHMVKLDSYTSINPYNPFLAMWTLVTRITERGSIIVPEEALTREQALRIYTINNARASFEENMKGSLEPGKYADLAVLSLDMLTCPVDKIKEIQAVMTMVDGKIVYNSGSLLP